MSRCKNCLNWEKETGQCFWANVPEHEQESKRLFFLDSPDKSIKTLLRTGPEFGCRAFIKNDEITGD